MDLEAVRCEEGLSTALLIAHKCVLAPVRLLVCSQVSRRAVRPGAAFEHALVALHLTEEEEETRGKLAQLKSTLLFEIILKLRKKDSIAWSLTFFQIASEKVIC